jgi:hypothetical protein
MVRADQISVIGIVVNLALFATTIFIWWESHKSAKAAVDAVKSADSTLKETRSEFNISNETYLHVQTKVLNFKANDTVRMAFFIADLKDIPVQIIGAGSITTWAYTGKFDSLYDRFRATLDEAKNTDRFRNIYRYINKGNRYDDTVHSTYAVPAEKLEEIQNGSLYLVFLCGIKYQNLVTGKLRMYRSMITYIPHPSIMFPRFVHNETFDDSSQTH